MKDRMMDILRPASRAAAILGLDFGKIFSAVRHYPTYFSQRRQFRRAGGDITHWYPVFIDYKDQAGSAKGHYFHQDLLVASRIHETRPARHIDIGSRVDGFVAHVASFRKIEVMDVRALDGTGHQNISFIQADLMNAAKIEPGVTDSLSCLHAIEHFGLGRYGEAIDPLGHIKGFNNMLKMLTKDGLFYISFPISRNNQVHFNAHRCFHPRDIFSWASNPESLTLLSFDYVDDSGELHRDVDIMRSDVDVRNGCGIYCFKKNDR